jgi:hypothetical protein
MGRDAVNGLVMGAAIGAGTAKGPAGTAW